MGACEMIPIPGTYLYIYGDASALLVVSWCMIFTLAVGIVDAISSVCMISLSISSSIRDSRICLFSVAMRVFLCSSCSCRSFKVTVWSAVKGVVTKRHSSTLWSRCARYPLQELVARLISAMILSSMFAAPKCSVGCVSTVKWRTCGVTAPKWCISAR